MRTVWHRAKANINRLLGNAPPETRIAHDSACRPPYEVMEMIIVHIAHNLNALTACSLTCRTWYIALVAHLHHTLTFADRKPKPLLKLYQLGLMPLIREIRVEQYYHTWLRPQAFSRRTLCYFTTFPNVQTLVLERLEIPRFLPDIRRYFGHFSPTLRSIALLNPVYTPRQLSHFLSLFPNLDDITIREFSKRSPSVTVPDTELVPFSTPRLRGRLVLHGINSGETWTRLIASGGGLQFRYMELLRVRGCARVLFKACAETLETLRLYMENNSYGE